MPTITRDISLRCLATSQRVGGATCRSALRGSPHPHGDAWGVTLPCSVAVLSHEGRFAEGVRVLTVALEGVTLLVTLVAARCVARCSASRPSWWCSHCS